MATKTKPKPQTNGSEAPQPSPEPTPQLDGADQELAQNEEELTEAQRKERDQRAERVEVEFGSYTFYIPKFRDFWPTKAEIALQRDQVIDLAEELLGPEQFELLTTVAAPERKDLKAFAAELGKAVFTKCVN